MKTIDSVQLQQTIADMESAMKFAQDEIHWLTRDPVLNTQEKHVLIAQKENKIIQYKFFYDNAIKQLQDLDRALKFVDL